MNTNLHEVDRHLNAINQKYAELSYLQRLKLMRQGLVCPSTSREYKEAMIEVQRLSAPLAAVLLPMILCGMMIFFSAVTDVQDQAFITTVIEIPPPPELEVMKPKEKITEKTDEVKVDVHVDQPNVENIKQTEHVMSPQPRPIDAVINTKSPIILKDIYGTKRGDSGTRNDLIKLFDGDPITEDAVMKTLRWLKKNQQPDGSWRNNRIAMTSLAILSFLAHAETPGKSEEFGETVKKGLEYLVAQQTPDGRFKGSDGHEYSLPIATYALCEAYGMTLNPNVKVAAERSLALIVNGQHPSGGWDYNVKQSDRDDTSYMGWCAQAIKAGYLAQVKVDGLDKALKLAVRGFKKNSSPSGGFGYIAPSANHGMTGVGTLCLQLLGAADEAEVTRSMEVMDKWVPSFEDKANGLSGTSLQYYFYYATQCRFHAGGKRWKSWNNLMKSTYVSAQKTLGKKESGYLDHKGLSQEIGWWENKDQHTDRPVMDSCLAALQLMVYYRNLPTTSVAALKPIEELNPSTTEKEDIIVSAANL